MTLGLGADAGAAAAARELGRDPARRVGMLGGSREVGAAEDVRRLLVELDHEQAELIAVRLVRKARDLRGDGGLCPSLSRGAKTAAYSA